MLRRCSPGKGRIRPSASPRGSPCFTQRLLPQGKLPPTEPGPRGELDILQNLKTGGGGTGPQGPAGKRGRPELGPKPRGKRRSASVLKAADPTLLTILSGKHTELRGDRGTQQMPDGALWVGKSAGRVGAGSCTRWGRVATADTRPRSRPRPKPRRKQEQRLLIRGRPRGTATEYIMTTTVTRIIITITSFVRSVTREKVLLAYPVPYPLAKATLTPILKDDKLKFKKVMSLALSHRPLRG